MITIKNKVGKGGWNATTDLAKIQLALYALKHLKKSHFQTEMVNHFNAQLSVDDSDNILSPFLSFSQKLKLLPKGTRRTNQDLLTATIQAIINFQSKVVGARRPDGRVDPGGRTLRIINQQLKKLPSPTAPPPDVPTSFGTGATGGRIGDGNSVEIVGDNIIIKISVGGKSEEKTISIQDCRNYITYDASDSKSPQIRFKKNNHNWNGLVKLMKFVYKENKDSYVSPNNLKGLKEDDLLIVPNQGILYIVKVQLAHQLKKMPARPRNLKAILRAVDGKVGNGFYQNILQKRKEVFVNEKDNKSFKDIFSNTKIPIPSVKDSESVLYDFFRKIVHTRNGLWSDNQGVVNIVGLRRVIDKMSKTAYNDGIAVCWKDTSGIPRVELSIATTEPGNRFRNRQVAPQTITMLPGYHHGRQPSGRTRNAVLQNSNLGSFFFRNGDTTMNFHQGATRLKVIRNHWFDDHGIGGLAKHGYPSRRTNAEQLFEMNLTLSEIYYLLSQYGWNGKEAPYQIMKKLAEAKPIKIDKIQNGIVTVSQKGVAQKQQINIHAVKKWMVNYWYHNRLLPKNKLKVFTIIQRLSPWDENRTKQLEKLNKKQILGEIVDEFIVKIIEKQIEYFPHLSDIDGKAGPVFYRALEGLRPSKTDAKRDIKKMNQLLQRLESLPFTNVKKLQRRLKNGMQTNTDMNREHIKLHSRYDETLQANVIEHATVGVYSAGCQVIYDNEKFYEFWTKLLQRAQQSGQRRWYYTLIDATGWKKTDVV